MQADGYITVRRRLVRAGVEGFARDVAREYGVRVRDSLERAHAFSPARHAFWYRVKHHSEREWSYPQIGKLVGYDNSSIFHGVKAHTQRLATATVRVCSTAGTVGGVGCCA